MFLDVQHIMVQSCANEIEQWLFSRCTFDLSYFQCQLRYRFTQYLILKVSLVVLRIEAVLWCDSTFILCYSILKTAICPFSYINRDLLNFILAGL